ncbi:MAG: hypothetical protein ACQEXB_21290 [Bacillota bacterium]
MNRFLFIGFLTLLLAGCSAGAAPDDGEKTSGDKAQSENITSEKYDEPTPQTDQDLFDKYQPNPQVTDDRSLQKVGDIYADGKGEATLKAYKDVNQTYTVGPIELIVKELKWIHLRPDYSMIDYFHVLTHDEEFDFVKVFVEIKNTSAENVNFAPIALIKTNTGETLDWEKDIYLEELNGELKGNHTKFGNLGFIVNASDSHQDEHNDDQQEESHDEKHQNDKEEPIEWIEITTSDVFDQEQKKISESQKIKIEF